MDKSRSTNYAKIIIEPMKKYLSDIRAKLYFIAGTDSDEVIKTICEEILCDPVTETYSWYWSYDNHEVSLLEIMLKPGVTDREADELKVAIKLLGLGSLKVATGMRYDTNRLEEVCNPVIHRYELGNIEPIFSVYPYESAILTYDLACLSDDELAELSVSRKLSLDLTEMHALKRICLELDRPLTDAEIETFAQTWSEHCSHKTFRTNIHYGSEIVKLLPLIQKTAKDYYGKIELVSIFKDNAGIVEVGGKHISFKVETHNHPSALEPFGGANTGVGGVIRDILGVSAKPIALTDVLCFGTENSNALPLKRLEEGIIAGVGDYGNKMGIPNVNGAIFHHPGYTNNPLVYCGCIGTSPINSHPTEPQLNDNLVVIGGGTGRDGLRGATFSSDILTDKSAEESGISVQIGNPITQRDVMEVILEARDAGLYNAITDCGAGGLSSAICEMIKDCGAEVRLTDVHLKYEGLSPWEIWLSEAQERMVLSIPDIHLPKFQDICDSWNTKASVIGVVTDNKKVLVRYGNWIIVDLPLEFLFEKQPLEPLEAEVWNPPNITRPFPPPSPLEEAFWKVISGISYQHDTVHSYDHEVQGNTVVKPGYHDAAVLMAFSGNMGLAIGNGFNQRYGAISPYRMGLSTVDEARRQVIAVGGDPSQLVLLDNFCWGNPKNPKTLGMLVEAVRGCCDACIRFNIPFISGKDSLNNEYIDGNGKRTPIPGSLLISSLAVVPDINLAITSDLKEPMNPIYLIGKTLNERGGSLYEQVTGQRFHRVPNMVEDIIPSQNLHEAILRQYVRSCHDLSEGGLAVAVVEMAVAGNLGIHINLSTLSGPNDYVKLFSESNSRWLAEIDADCSEAFEGIVPDAVLCGHVESTEKITLGPISTTVKDVLFSLTNSMVCDRML